MNIKVASVDMLPSKAILLTPMIERINMPLAITEYMINDSEKVLASVLKTLSGNFDLHQVSGLPILVARIHIIIARSMTHPPPTSIWVTERTSRIVAPYGLCANDTDQTMTKELTMMARIPVTRKFGTMVMAKYVKSLAML